MELEILLKKNYQFRSYIHGLPQRVLYIKFNIKIYWF
jgi:hypothetical protein